MDVYIYTHIYIHNFSEIIVDYESMPAQHILRLTAARISKLVYEYYPAVRRDVGRPKLRWRDKNPRVPKIPYISYPIAAVAAAAADDDDDCTKTYTRLCSHLECNFTKYLLGRQIFGSDV